METQTKNNRGSRVVFTHNGAKPTPSSHDCPLFLFQTNVLYCIVSDVQQFLNKNPLTKSLQVLSEPKLGRNPEASVFCVLGGDESCEQRQHEVEPKNRISISQPVLRNAPVLFRQAIFKRLLMSQAPVLCGLLLVAGTMTSWIPSCSAEAVSTGSNFNSYNVERLVSAIYLAEGGERAKKPFGILSVPCSDYSSCKKICTNTVRNNLKRWEKAGKPGDYLEFLAKKYAPVGMGKNSNDPRNLNKNWYSNVKKIYRRLK